MDILFSSERLKNELSRTKALSTKYGPNATKRLKQRLLDLAAIDCLEGAKLLPGRCHELKGNRYGQLAMRLHGGYRLVFEPADKPPPSKPDGGLDWKQIKSIRILEVEDYHD